ncbi:MAG TPA: hypothetical protein GXZ48_00800 [Acholeplasmataceae bacterium]|nr:hypothetical protein [Acholeplasmataceae bacterium]
MKKVIFFSALLIAGTIGLAILLVLLFIFALGNFAVIFFAVILILMILIGLIGGILSIVDHDRRC